MNAAEQVHRSNAATTANCLIKRIPTCAGRTCRPSGSSFSWTRRLFSLVLRFRVPKWGASSWPMRWIITWCCPPLSLSLFLRAFLFCCFFFLGRVIVKFGALNRKRFFFFLIREQPPAKHRTHTCCCSPLMHGTRHMSCTFAGHGRSHAYPLSETGGVNADSGAAAQRIKGADGRVVDRQTLTDNRELRISISPDNIWRIITKITGVSCVVVLVVIGTNRTLLSVRTISKIVHLLYRVSAVWSNDLGADIPPIR